MKVMEIREWLLGVKEPSHAQLKYLSSLCSGLGQIVFGSIILGFFFPGIAGKVSPMAFISALTIVPLSFMIGLQLLREVKE